MGSPPYPDPSRRVRTALTTPATSSPAPTVVSIGGTDPRSTSAYPNAASVSNTMSWPATVVGNRLLASFQHCDPTRHASNPRREHHSVERPRTRTERRRPRAFRQPTHHQESDVPH